MAAAFGAVLIYNACHEMTGANAILKAVFAGL
jgi:hypothetical protein